MHENPGISTSLSYIIFNRFSKAAFISSSVSCEPEYAAIVPYWAVVVGLEVLWLARLVIALIISLFPAAYPIRQPVIECDLDTPLIIIVCSFSSGESSAIDVCLWPP